MVDIGLCKPLHIINPLRLDFITARSATRSKVIIVVVAGILTEALAKKAAQVLLIKVTPS